MAMVPRQHPGALRAGRGSRRLRWPSPAQVACAVATVCAATAARGQVLPRVPTEPLQAVPAAAASAPVGAEDGATAAPVGLAQAGASAGVGAAPSTYVVPSVSVLATQSSNANFGAAAAARSDTIVEVVPRIFLATDHARWQLRGDLGVDGTYYARGAQPDVLAPSGYADLHSELSERLLYFDAGMSATRSAINPYVAQGGPVQASTYTSTKWRLSPYVDRLLRPGLRLQARSDDTWTTVGNTPQNAGISGGRYLDQTFSLVQAPVDWGYGVAAEQIYSTYNDQPYAWLRDTTLRATLSRAVTPNLVIGVIGGREKVSAFHATQSEAIYGLQTQWNGGEGAQLRGRVEHRFFGTGWDLQAAAGSSRLRLSASWQRGATSNLAPVQGSTAGANLSSLLDGMLRGQYPNPLQRAQAVQNLLGESGLPAGLPTSGGFFTTSTVLQNNLVVSALLLLPRDSFAVSLYRNRTEDLYLPGQQVLQLIQAISADNLQSGAAFNYGHRLTPLDNINVTLQREVDSGFGLNQGRSARLSSLILQLDHRMSPSTIAIAGVRRRLLRSTLAGDANETGLFAGLVHRF